MSRVKEALGAIYRESVWRSMDTAPTDGTPILVWGEAAGEINGPDEFEAHHIASWAGGRTDYPGYDWDVAGGDAYACWVKPVAWMPLPSSPEGR